MSQKVAINRRVAINSSMQNNVEAYDVYDAFEV